MHTSIIHKYREKTESFVTEIKSEPEEIELPMVSSNNPTTLTENQNLNTKSLKQNVQEKEAIKCKICEAIFFQKKTLNEHIASVHEGKKPFKCNRCEASYTSNKNSYCLAVAKCRCWFKYFFKGICSTSHCFVILVP